MKVKNPLLIAGGITAVLAVISVFFCMTRANLLTTLVYLVVFWVAMSAGKKPSVVSSAPVILLSWIHFASRIFAGAEGAPASYTQLVENLGHFMSNLRVWPILLLILLGVLAFVLKKSLQVIILIRYAAMLAFLISFFGTQSVTVLLMLALVVVNASIEYHTRGLATPLKRFPDVLKTAVIFLFLNLSYNFCPEYQYGELLFAGNSFSVYAIVLIGMLAGLIMMEKYYLDEGESFGFYDFSLVGPAMLFWCITALIGMFFPAAPPLLSMLGAFMIFDLFNYGAREWRKRALAAGTSVKPAALCGVGALAALCLPVLNKSFLLTGKVSFLALLLLPFVGIFVWQTVKMAEKKKKAAPDMAQKCLIGYLGIAAVILLAASMKSPSNGFEALAVMILLVVLCVFWCLVSGQIIRLNRTASLVDKAEFQILSKVQNYVPVAVLLIALVKILFLKNV